MCQNQTESNPTNAEQPTDEGLSSSVLFGVADLPTREMPDGETLHIRPKSLEEHARWLQWELWNLTKWQDNYGVPGSDWDVCKYCGQQDQPGIFATGVRHLTECPMCPRDWSELSSPNSVLYEPESQHNHFPQSSD
jgi:hypothetical protein